MVTPTLRPAHRDPRSRRPIEPGHPVLKGVFLCTRAEMMLPRRSGLVINISSGVGQRAAPHWGPYAVAKWGVEGMTRAAGEIDASAGASLDYTPS